MERAVAAASADVVTLGVLLTKAGSTFGLKITVRRWMHYGAIEIPSWLTIEGWDPGLKSTRLPGRKVIIRNFKFNQKVCV